MNLATARMTLSFACLLSFLLLSAAARSKSSVVEDPSQTTLPSTNTTNENSATAKSFSKVPKSLRKRCKKHCLVEALQGNKTRAKENFCARLCPEYQTPEEYLDPDAECTRCPDAACQRCRCDSGECLLNSSNATVDGEIPKVFRSFHQPVGGTPTISQYCASCRPRKNCRPFWFCRGKKRT